MKEPFPSVIAETVSPLMDHMIGMRTAKQQNMSMARNKKYHESKFLFPFPISLTTINATLSMICKQMIIIINFFSRSERIGLTKEKPLPISARMIKKRTPRQL
jgi:hypothetical protein